MGDYKNSNVGGCKVFELCDDGFHVDCVVIEYEGHRILAKKLDSEYVEKCVNHEFTKLDGPFSIPERLPYEYARGTSNPVFPMDNGSLKTLYIYNHMCPEQQYKNSNAAAIAHESNGGKMIYGNAIAVFE